MTGTFTGRHITLILVAFFGVVMAVNFTMAYFASATFGGTVVDNSYVASQQFNGWLEKARAEKALGWSLDTVRTPDHHVIVSIAQGAAPLPFATVTALARHPLGRLPERTLAFRALGGGRYESLDALPAGRWILHLRAVQGRWQINRIVDLQ
ncbi:FixH family protein [Sphingobium nicotianae]|uniref:FixH family protein n=1 Tax=Sphingobium nicotianae TaxID=2782607 RepID=A0A9X1DFN4_9SPHN|nr:FixH family protein [Sphingobium nicotianae]MBT2189039.1 FixH family protein [Sphingobium nicotianae]